MILTHSRTWARALRAVLLSSAAGFAALPLAAAPTAAQENGAGEQQSDRILVTGSRIKRSEFSLPVPVQTLTIEDLEISGVNEISEALTELPSVFTGTNTENSQSSTQNSGASTISLRRLGSDRTLTLINGRRTVTNSSTGSVVSLSTIPDSFIERIDVITGGASAVYGSDAVAGVVNIIMRDSFDGLRVSGRMGTSEQGGNDERSFEIMSGGVIDGGRGNVMMAYEYDWEGAINSEDRDFSLLIPEVDQNTNDQPDVFEPGLSSNIPGGLFAGNSGTIANPDRDSTFWFFNNGVLTPDFSTDDNGYSDRVLTTISIPRQRHLFAAKADYEFTPWAEGFFDVQYSHTYTKSQRAPDSANSSRLQLDYPIYLADGVTPNPFVPQEIFDDALEVGRDSVFFRRRWNELSPRFREADNDTLRAWTGLRGTVFEDWDYEAFVGFGEFRRAQSRVGDLVIPNYQAAVTLEADPDNPGQLRCASELARAGGCAPLNVFGEGSVSEDAAEWLILRDQLRARNRTTTAGAFVTGSPFSLWAGPVDIALGYEYRNDETRTRWDPITLASQGTVTGQSNEEGSIQVHEVFIEAVVPLAHNLSIEAAVRGADYSTVGTTTSWKFGGTWQPTPDVRFRAVLARAERAPNTIELFANGIGSQGGLADLCDMVTATSTEAFHDACRQDPVLAAIIASDGIFVDPSVQVQNPSVGNSSLTEETADTLTVGAVFTPRFAPGLTFSVDYFDIEIEDAIGEIDAEDVLRFCYGNAGGFGASSACDLITRDAATGQLAEVVEAALNLNSLHAEGYDFGASYAFTPSETQLPLLNALPGDISLSLVHSYMMENTEDVPIPPSGGGASTESELLDRAGLIGTSQHNSRVRASWKNGPFTVSWRGVRIGEALNDDADHTRLNTCQQFNNCGDKLVLFIEPEWFHNVRISYDTSLFTEDTNIYVGINNIANNTGPILYDGDNNFDSTYDITGRFFYAGFDVTF